MYFKINLESPTYYAHLRQLVGPVSYFFSWLNTKLLGLTVPIIYRYLDLPALLPCNPRLVPARLREKVGELLAEPTDHRLRLEAYYAQLLPGIPQIGYGAVLLPDDRLACVVVNHSAGAWPDTTVSCISRLRDGSIRITTDEPDWTVWIARCSRIKVECLPYDRSYAEDIVSEHYCELATCRDDVIGITPETLQAFLTDTLQAINDS